MPVANRLSACARGISRRDSMLDAGSGLTANRDVRIRYVRIVTRSSPIASFICAVS
jgi:hypothetical protein